MSRHPVQHMGIAIDPVTLELESVVRSFLERHDAIGAARAAFDDDNERLPVFWDSLVRLGWLGIHLDEGHGGQGGGISELAVVLEQMGRHVAPGPFLPATLASAVIAAVGTDAQRRTWLPAMADGTTLGAIGLGGTVALEPDGTLHGDAGLVLGGALAQALLLRVGDDLVIADAGAHVTVAARRNLDPTRRVAAATATGAAVGDDRVLRGAHTVAIRLARTLAAAEAVGLARACTERATRYAKERVQFGRPIGSFQAVKHHCANMLVDTEMATAAAWNAADDGAGGPSPFAAAVAATLAVPAAIRAAKLHMQVHGGIGYTWEHDAHLFVRRAQALAALFGPVDAASEDVAAIVVAQLAGGCPAVARTVALPPEAEELRAEVEAFAKDLRSLPSDQQYPRLVESGYAFPHWPTPWGRSAGALEQLVVDEVLGDVPRPLLGIGGWVTQTIAAVATPEQAQRWIRPSQLGAMVWCQLFSEPNAGSDAAAIQTRGVRTDGGWLVSGQKVWTSVAHEATHGFATVRTNPDVAKHAGITTMVIDMRVPGVDVRPLRDLTGATPFNEVFLDDVFVPDDDVVGEVDGGWAVARATLGNERLSIGGDPTLVGADAAGLLALLEQSCLDDVGHLRSIGRLIAQNHALQALNLRTIARAVAGGPPGPEGNVTKLVVAEHGQAVRELALALHGQIAAVVDGSAAADIDAFFFSRQATIAGGTSEIARNQIGERLLGLPREPAAR